MKVVVALLCLLGVTLGYYTEDELRAKGRGDPVRGTQVVPTQGQPWPKPQMRKDYQGYMVVRPSAFQFKVVGKDCQILRDALKRYLNLIESATESTHDLNSYKPWKKDPEFEGYLDVVQVNIMSKCDDWPVFNMDEHYLIKINNPDEPNTGSVVSETVWGVIRGLETLVQLMYPAADGAGLKIGSTMVEDFPRFPHRGLMLDTARHYLPLDKILENIELMAFNKFNVFHWHLVDDQSFPYECKAFPALSEKGAYDPTHVYTRDNISEVIEFARVRGIRVVPEFDSPGHTEAWGPGQPGLLTPCYSGKKPDGTYGPIDPTNEANFQFLRTFFQDARDVFQDKYVHLGGDEVSFSCWKSNPQVTEFMKAHNFTGNYAKLEEYYIQRLVDIVAKQGSSYLVWQEVVDNGVHVDNKTIVHVWIGGDDYAAEMEKVTSLGYQTILSSCWYLNYISYGIDWHKYYDCDPYKFNGTQAQYDLVHGGEACMWAEFVDATNLTPRLWPRASVVAERLWSSRQTTDLDDAEKRLEEHRCRLLARGYPVEPANGPGFCKVEWNH